MTKQPVGGREKALPVKELAEILENCLVIGELRPRETLVVEDVSRRFGYSTYVTRRTIELLVQKKLLVKQQHNSATVRDFTLEEVCQYYEAWKVLVEAGMRTLPLPSPKSFTDDLRAIATEHEASIDLGDRLETYRLNKKFHETLYAACGNDVLTEMYVQTQWTLQFLKSYRMYDADRLRVGVASHHRMIDAIERGDRNALLEISLAHQTGPALLYQESQIWSPRGVLTVQSGRALIKDAIKK